STQPTLTGPLPAVGIVSVFGVDALSASGVDAFTAAGFSVSRSRTSDAGGGAAVTDDSVFTTDADVSRAGAGAGNTRLSQSELHSTSGHLMVCFSSSTVAGRAPGSS